jgi:transposase
MHIDVVPNRGSKPSVLLRECFREGKKVHKRTLANLSKLPMEQVEAIRQILKGEQLVRIDELFQVIEGGSRAHGHVEAVLLTMKRLGFEELIASRSSRERDLVVALVVARILKPRSKLATVRWWNETTLPECLGVTDADEDELYAAMDWLLQRQSLIDKKLAARHLENDGLVLYDLTSSYFEGVTCPLAALGHDRDGKKGKLQVNYGLLTNRRGIPISVSVFEGNTGDPKTLLPQVDKVKNEFGIERFVLVGDRGMITQKQINELRDMEGVDWIAALRPEAIKKLVNSDALQMGFFDERNLFEVTHPDFPGERLVACKNPELAKKRAHKRQSLLDATAAELEKVRLMVGRGRLHGKEQIGEVVSKVLSKYKVGENYTVEVRDDGFDVSLDESRIAEEAARAARRNPRHADKNAETRNRHIEAIAAALEKVRQKIDRGQLHGKAAIGVRVGKVINKYKVSKHFKLDIQDDGFNFEVDQQKVAQEAALDGIYVVRTSLPQARLDADDTVRTYKLLSQVERAFRSFKTVDLKVRPIHHHLEDRVRAHILLCMLAYYVEWHMLEAWRPLLFSDEDQDAKARRDPVAPAKRSDAALRKVHTKKLDDGTEVHSFETLIGRLSKIVRNQCRRRDAASDAPTFHIDTTPDPKQQKAYDLLKAIRL